MPSAILWLSSRRETFETQIPPTPEGDSAGKVGKVEGGQETLALQRRTPSSTLLNRPQKPAQTSACAVAVASIWLTAGPVLILPP